MKNSELFTLANVLNGLGGITGADVNFTYAIAKNKKKVSEEVEIIRQAVKQPENENYDKFMDERRAVDKMYCIKDDKGEPQVTPEGRFQFQMADIPKYNSALKKIDDKYPEVVKMVEATNKENNKLMDKDANIELFKFELSSVPRDITPSQMEALLPVILDKKE